MRCNKFSGMTTVHVNEKLNKDGIDTNLILNGQAFYKKSVSQK